MTQQRNIVFYPDAEFISKIRIGIQLSRNHLKQTAATFASKTTLELHRMFLTVTNIFPRITERHFPMSTLRKAGATHRLLER